MIFAVCCLAGTPAFAKSPDLPVTGCFARDYTDAHLAKYPAQVVDRIILKIADRTYSDDGRSWTQREARLSVLTANQGHVAKDGKGGQRFDQWMYCDHDSVLGPFCTVECDGGHMTFSTNTPERIVFRTKTLWVGDVEDEGCGGAVNIAEVPGQVTAYRLDRVNQAACDAAFPKE